MADLLKPADVVRQRWKVVGTSHYDSSCFAVVVVRCFAVLSFTSLNSTTNLSLF